MHRVGDPERFYEQPVGQLFHEEVILTDPVRTNYINPSPERLGDQSISEYRGDLLQAYARWYNGNYDPEMGRCILYRGVDEDRKDELDQSGAITTRAVNIFGQGDVGLAAANLRGTAAGEPPIEVIENIVGLAEENVAAALDSPKRNNPPLRAIDAMRALQKHLFVEPDPDLQAEMLRAADDLEKSLQLNDETYKMIMDQAAQDHCPPSDIIRGWSHRYIHLTTNRSFVENIARRIPGRYPWTLEVSFVPGTLPVAPSIGYLAGQLYHYQQPPRGGAAMNHHLPDIRSEAEWYGIGAIESSDDVSITATRTL
jgi:hypothetical protein